MAKKKAATKKTFTRAKARAKAGVKAITKAQKNLDLQVKKHGKHLTAMFEHNV